MNESVGDTQIQELTSKTTEVAIRLFLAMLRTRHFRWFAYYCWLIGGGYLLAAIFAPGLR